MKRNACISVSILFGLIFVSSLAVAGTGSGNTSEQNDESRTAAADPLVGRQAFSDADLLTSGGRAAQPGTNGFGDGPGCPISVGPGAGCDYNSLQAAINDAEVGSICGHIAVTVDYSLTTATNITHLIGWDTPSGTPAWLMGGFPDCNDLDPDNATTTVLDGENDSSILGIAHTAEETDPLSELRIENFEFRNGYSEFGSGGLGIWGVPGRLAVELINVDFVYNTSEVSGGAIRVRTSDDGINDDPQNPPPPMLFIDDDSNITFNEAEEKGGGVYCWSGHDHNDIVMLRTGAGLISRNEATDGGGVALSNCLAIMRNGGPFLGIVPTGGIMLNESSSRGGGLFAENGSMVFLRGELADAELGGDPNSAFMIGGNEAEVGGGIYLTDADTWVFATRTRIFGNSSQGGGGGVFASEEAQFDLILINEDRGLPCRSSFSDGLLNYLPPCNVLAENSSFLSAGAADAFNGAELRLQNVFITGNTGGNTSAIFAGNSTMDDDTPAQAQIINSVVAENDGSNYVLYAANGFIDVRWTTVANNEYSNSLFHAWAGQGRESGYDIRSSIVWQDSGSNMATRAGEGETTASVDCIIAFEPLSDTDITSSFFYSVIDPEFIDPDDGNYRLSGTSPAINYCDGISSPPDYDLDGQPRGEEYPNPTTPAPNPHPNGVFDLGAFVAPADEMFSDRFEAN